MEAVPSHSDCPPPPVHVAIIMDGNGRWAAARGLPRAAGHRRGVEAVRTTVETALDLGVSYLTLFGFSTENWRRPALEVSSLMGLLRLYLRSEIADLHRNGVRLRIVGDRKKLNEDIVALIEEGEALTASNRRLTLTIAISYGGRQEIADVARRLAGEVAAGKISLGEIDERAFADRLFTADIPDPDVLIRTSGEKRLSNFLLWQLAYSELIFVETLWPDFSRRDLEEAIRDFQSRERRYGMAGA